MSFLNLRSLKDENLQCKRVISPQTWSDQKISFNTAAVLFIKTVDFSSILWSLLSRYDLLCEAMRRDNAQAMTKICKVGSIHFNVVCLLS